MWQWAGPYSNLHAYLAQWDSIRNDKIHNFLSVYDLYLNLARCLPFLECFKISVGIIKVTDSSFRTILDMLNNLTVILRAPSSKIKLEAFVSAFFLLMNYYHLAVQSTWAKILTSHTKLNFGFGGLKLNTPVKYLSIFWWLFNEFQGGISTMVAIAHLALLIFE